MVIIYGFFLILSVFVFLLTYRLRRKTRVMLALVIAILPSIAITSYLLILRDRPLSSSYIWYAGPAHIDPNTPGELEYQRKINEAKNYEDRKMIKEAIKTYQETLVVKRIVVPSYYVLFDIGRLQYQDKQYNNAVISLKKYLSNVHMELTYREGKGVNEPPAGGFMVADETEEHLTKVIQNKENAEILIKRIEVESNRNP